MFGKIHTHIVFVAILAAVSAVSQSTKQVTRMGMELHLQSNSFQIKKIQVLHLITIAYVQVPQTLIALERENIPELNRLQIQGISESVA